LNFLYIFVFLVVPMIHIGFAVVLSMMTAKV
jgi:hypothetical protein